MSTFQGFQTRYANTVTSDFRIFALLDAIDYIALDGTRYRLPKAARSDLASIPRPLWSLLPPTGADGAEYGLAAFLHDLCYRDTLLLVNPDGSTQLAHLTKERSDNLLREAMLACQVPAAIVETIYEAVVLAGGSSFAGDR